MPYIRHTKTTTTSTAVATVITILSPKSHKNNNPFLRGLQWAVLRRSNNNKLLKKL